MLWNSLTNDEIKLQEVGVLAILRWLVSNTVKKVIGWLTVLHNSAHVVHVASVLRLKLSKFYDNDVCNSCVCVTRDPWTTVRHINHRQTNDNQGLYFSARFEMYPKTNPMQFLQPPTNGYFANNCDDWHVGNTCEPKCNDGYAFFSHQANTTYRYQCTQQGQWTPAPDTMPECLGELRLNSSWYHDCLYSYLHFVNAQTILAIAL